MSGGGRAPSCQGSLRGVGNKCARTNRPADFLALTHSVLLAIVA